MQSRPFYEGSLISLLGWWGTRQGEVLSSRIRLCHGAHVKSTAKSKDLSSRLAPFLLDASLESVFPPVKWATALHKDVM